MPTIMKATAMRKRIFLLLSLALLVFAETGAQNAAEFETASEAVANMRIGWNLGNTLDSNSGDTLNMWIEFWNKGAARTTAKYETAWGQPVTEPELFVMLKNAGFNAVRVPVTWYPHMEAKFNIKDYGNDKKYWYPSKDDIGTKIDSKWMKRVRQVVDYVLDAGMYCIINVHHDTGGANTAWILADKNNYAAQKERFGEIWRQIATEFRDYDEHLLFEGYNEMLDSYRSWCFASYNFPSSDRYNALSAGNSYTAINNYAQCFVDAVRSTGGNNLTRNLIVSTYGACSGAGTWNTHLTEPLSKMKVPQDTCPGHIAVEVHTYPDISDINKCRNEVKQMMVGLKVRIADRLGVPVIIGEWGSADVDNPDVTIPRSNKLQFATYLVSLAKSYGFGTFYWMGLSNGDDRSVPKWTEKDLVDAIVKGYYGEGGYDGVGSLREDTPGEYHDLSGRLIAKPVPGSITISGGRKYYVK